LAIPLVALTWRAVSRLDNLDEQSSATIRDALTLSGLTSMISLLVIVAVGTPLALFLGRSQFRGQSLIDTLIDLPMVLPPAVAGLALLMAFGRRGLLGGLLDDAGVRVGFTTTAVVVAQIFVAAPFYVRAARGAFARIDRSLEEVAAVLGASPGVVFRRVTVPIALPGLSAGAVLAWARAVGEFGATIMFAGNLPRETQTMPLAIYSRYESGDLESALILALLLLVSSSLVLISVRTIGGRLRYGVSE
jgi:molybdate transport system permease protein